MAAALMMVPTMRQTETRAGQSSKRKVRGVPKISVAIHRDKRQVHTPGTGRSVAWLARLFRVQEVVSSNLTAPTILTFYSITKGPKKM